MGTGASDKRVLPDKGVILAFDFGLARIGVATGNFESGTATPLTTCRAVGGEPIWPAIHRLIDEWEPVALIVGRPDVDPGRQFTAMLGKFVRALGRRYAVPTILYSEAMSSASARAVLRRRRRLGLCRKTTRGDVDKAAAAIILEDFLGSRQCRRIRGSGCIP